jgi:hypothetical protein
MSADIIRNRRLQSASINELLRGRTIASVEVGRRDGELDHVCENWLFFTFEPKDGGPNSLPLKIPVGGELSEDESFGSGLHWIMR